MRRIVYEDATITEYADGREEVRFTADEWERMLADPAFGYVCRLGHRLSDADHRYGACLTCEHLAEYEYDPEADEPLTSDEQAALDAAVAVIDARRAAIADEPF